MLDVGRLIIKIEIKEILREIIYKYFINENIVGNLFWVKILKFFFFCVVLGDCLD